jgi:AcrR family transcriptional regulator
MDKRNDILRAAERLFYNNGFHATSTDHICSEANVSTRTLYRYFPSRESLTASVMEQRKNRFFSALYPAEHVEAIDQLFRELKRWMDENGAQGCFFVKAWAEYAEHDMTLAALALDYRYMLRHYIAACINHSHGVNREALINVIWILFEGASTTALLTGSQAALDAGNAAALLMKKSGAAQ